MRMLEPLECTAYLFINKSMWILKLRYLSCQLLLDSKMYSFPSYGLSQFN